jgi:hypothetical protein
MHGTEHRDPERRTPRLFAPRKPFSPASGLTLQGTSQPLRLSVTGTGRSQRPFARPQRLPLSRPPFQGQSSRPTTSRSKPAVSATRSAFLLHNLKRFAPLQAASLRLARCCFRGWLPRLLPQPPLPFGTFRSSRIKAFGWFRCRSARLPNSPDLRSLPAADVYC